MVKRNVRMAKAMLKLSLRNAIISSLKVMLRNSRYLSRMCDGEKHIMIQTMASLMEPRPVLMWSHIPGVLKWICSSRLEHHAWILVVVFGICSNICVIREDNPDYVLSTMTKRGRRIMHHEARLDKVNEFFIYSFKLLKLNETTRDYSVLISSS